MTDKVVDASALAAVVFQEDEDPDIRSRLRDCSLHAPSLFRYEIVSVCLKKIRRHPQLRGRLLEQLGILHALTIQEYSIDPHEVAILAEHTKLSAYDASYLWLALRLDAELVTLDEKLEKAARRS